jgi:NADH dehydrogenase
VIVGGGPTGIEVASEISEFVDTLIPYYPKFVKNKVKVDIKILNSSDNFLPNFPSKLKKKVYNIFNKSKAPVSLVLDAKVLSMTSSSITLTNNKTIDYDVAIWAAGVSANVPQSNLKISESGRILVSPTLNVKDNKNVFAIGDVAEIEGVNLPQLAQVAVDESKICANNIAALMESNPLEPFNFKPKGFLLSLGHNNAAVSIKNTVIVGKFAWILWRYFYLYQMFGKGSKIKILFNWIINEFSPRDISKI